MGFENGITKEMLLETSIAYQVGKETVEIVWFVFVGLGYSDN